MNPLISFSVWINCFFFLLYEQDHENKTPSKCKKCGFKCFDKDSSANHICITKEELKKQNLNVRCGFCGKAGRTAGGSFNYHLAGHDDDAPRIKCPVRGCRGKFKLGKYMEKHKLKAHAENVKKIDERQQCQHCGAILANRKSLKVSAFKRF